MPRTRKLPWDKWDEAINQYGEWVLIAAIGCASLPPTFGSLMLSIALYFFLTRLREMELPEIARFNHLRDQRARRHLSKEEEIELSEYEAGRVMEPPKRNFRLFLVGTIAVLLVYLYHGLSLIGINSRY